MRTLITLGTILLLAACDTGGPKSVTTNLDYANTSLGFRNSGLLAPGRLMLWDTQTNDLITLATNIKMKANSSRTRTTLKASQVRGIEIGAGASLTSQDEANIKAAVENKVEFTVKEARRVNRTEQFSAVSATYIEAKNNGEDPFTAWRLDEAVADPGRYKIVLLDSEIKANSEEITIGGTAGIDAKLTVAGEGQGGIDVSFPRSTTASCAGDQVPCYINATVVTALLKSNGNLSYRRAAFDREALSAALRNLN